MTLAALMQAAQQPHRHGLLHMVAGMGMLGLFLISIVDSSFVPLPVPGVTDILLILLAAKQQHWIWMTVIATVGSVIGGGLTYHLGVAGGVHALEKRVPAKYMERITRWTSQNGFLAVAIPAILPPPVPLIPFVIAAGALGVPRKKFYLAFTLSRGIRHGLAAWLGYHFGRNILRQWNQLSARWETPIQILMWVAVIGVAAWVIWKLLQYARQRRIVEQHL